MLKFSLITPEKVAMEETVYEVILPTVSGQIAVFPGHISLVTLLEPGIISIRRHKGDADDNMEHLATSGGFVEVTGSYIKIMADTAERADDLDELKIEAAKEEAKRRMREARDEVAFTDAAGALQVELARIKVRNMKRRRTNL